MKSSTAVLLVLSGAILNGCSDKPAQPDWGDAAQSGQVYTNNTYVAGRGYYHAPYYRFYPFPYNSYVPGSGYYHGGSYASSPNVSPIGASVPAGSALSSGSSSLGSSSKSSVSRGGFTRSGSSIGSSSHSSSGAS